MSRLARSGPLLPLLLGMALVYLPLLWRGLPVGHDWLFELRRVVEFGSALAAGDVPPGWAPGLYGGYGSPIFLFYAPLHMLAASLLALCTGSSELGIRLALLLTAGVGFWSARLLLLRATGSVSAARLSAGFYVLHPYVIGDAFLRNAHAEFTALCLLPAAGAALLGARERPWRAALGIAAGLAAVLLAHNLTALVAAAALAAGAVLVHGPEREPRTWIAIAGGTALGLALAAFFWLPALLLSELVRPEELLVGKFDFHNQFPPARSVFGYAQFYAAGLLQPAVLVAACVVLVRQSPEGARDRLLIGALAAAALLLFLLTPYSTLLWEHVPFMPFFQFPWRLLGPLALAVALAGALAFAEVERRLGPRRALLLEAGLALLVLLNAGPRLGQVEWAAPGAAEASLERGPLRERSDGATVRDEYLPRGAVHEVARGRSRAASPVVSVDPPAEVRVLGRPGAHVELEVQAAQPTRLRLARWAFPGWQLEVGGAPVELATAPTGAIDVQVPAGQSSVSLRWVGPPLRRAGNWLSLAALCAWLALALREFRRGGRESL